jgi:hypothetical protein
MSYNSFMGTNIIETRKIGSATFRIVSIDDKYTVYMSKDDGHQINSEDSIEYSAVASFDTLTDAKNYLDTHVA